MGHTYALKYELLSLGFQTIRNRDGVFKFKDEKDIVYVAYWGSYITETSGNFEAVTIHDSVTGKMSKPVTSREKVRELVRETIKKAQRELSLNKVFE